MFQYQAEVQITLLLDVKPALYTLQACNTELLDQHDNYQPIAELADYIILDLKISSPGKLVILYVLY
jgi:hypothetical protein